MIFSNAYSLIADENTRNLEVSDRDIPRATYLQMGPLDLPGLVKQLALLKNTLIYCAEIAMLLPV